MNNDIIDNLFELQKQVNYQHYEIIKLLKFASSNSFSGGGLNFNLYVDLQSNLFCKLDWKDLKKQNLGNVVVKIEKYTTDKELNLELFIKNLNKAKRNAKKILNKIVNEFNIENSKIILIFN